MKSAKSVIRKQIAFNRQFLSELAYVSRKADPADLIHLRKDEVDILTKAFDTLYESAKKYM